MSSAADWIRWQASCRHVSNRGTCLTPGDIVHCGYGDYYAPRPMPNGLPYRSGGPLDTEWGRARHERLRREIDRHTERCRLNAIEGSGVVFTSDDVAEIKSIVEGVFNE